MMMENVTPAKALMLGTDDDIWDRVHTLAPTKPPVKTRLFRQAPRRVAEEPTVETVSSKALPAVACREPEPAANAERRDVDMSPEPAATPAEILDPVSTAPLTVTPDDGADGRGWERLRVATTELNERKASARVGLFLNGNSSGAQPFDQLRTRLFQSLKANGWSRVAITAPAPGCGVTFTACNLALSLSRLNAARTVLMDLNLRSPGIARTLGLRPQDSLRRFLTGEVPLTEGLVRYSDNLAVGLTASGETAAAEVLHDPRTAATLDGMRHALTPDVLLYDMPPMLGYDDVDAFLPQVDGVLLVVDGTRTVARQVAECERMIAGKTRLLGVVLNRSRDKVSQKLRYAG